MTLHEQIIRAWELASLMSDTAIVAGGCLRDLCAGVPAKDIDVFINQPFQTSLRDGWVVGGLAENDDLEKYTYGEDGDDVSNLLSIIRQNASDGEPDDLPIQIIVNAKVMTEQKLINRFDFGVCQIACGDGRNLIYSDQFIRDFRDRKLTYLREHSRMMRTTRNNAWVRAYRFQKKLGFDIDIKSMPIKPEWEYNFHEQGVWSFDQF